MDTLKRINGKVDNKSLVVKSNTLIEKAYNLGLREQKIILLLASNIKKEDADFQPLVFKISDIAKFIGVNEKTGSIYPQIRSLTKELRKKGFDVEYTNEKGDLEVLQVGWLSSAKYFVGKGEVQLRFDPELKPFLLFLKNNFTKYELGNIANLRSIYSIRIYELLKQYQTIGSREFSIDDFKSILKIDGKPMYKNITKLQEMIELAKDELNEKCDLAFNYELIKEGRKYASIRFTFRENDARQRQASLFDEMTTPVNEELKQSLMDFGIKENVAVNLLQKYRDDIVKNNIAFMLDKIDKKKIIHDKAGFLVEAIKQNYAYQTPEDRKQIEAIEMSKKNEKEKRDAFDKNKRARENFYSEYLKYAYSLVDEYLNTNDLKEIKQRFEDDSIDFIKTMIARNTFKSTLVQDALKRYIKNNLLNDKLSFVDWLKQTHNIKAKQVGEDEKDIKFIS